MNTTTERLMNKENIICSSVDELKTAFEELKADGILWRTGDEIQNCREEAEADKNISAYFAYRSSHSLLLSRRILSTLFAWSCNFLTSIITLQFL